MLKVMTSFPLCSFLFSVFALASTLGQDADSTTVTVDKLSIAQLIDDTVAVAKKGVDSTALGNSLESIQQLADNYLNERGAIVDGQDIVAVVGEITAKTNWQLTLSALLEDPLVQEERKVTAGLFVLNGLSFGIRAINNDTQVNIIVAAVRFTAKSVGRSLTIGETLYNYKEEYAGNQDKRWAVVDTSKSYDGFHNHGQHNVHRRNIRRKRWGFSIGAQVGVDFG